MMTRNVRRLLVVAAVLAVLLGAGMVLWIGRTPAPLALPNPNGYDILLKAGQAVAGKIDDARELDHEGLRSLVATNAEALRLLRTGLAHRCVVPTDAQIANYNAIITRDMVALKSLAQVLSAEGRLAEMENRPADAARSYIDSIRLGTEMSRGGLLINRLVGIACEGMGIIPLVKLLPKLTCEQMRPVIAELEQIDDRTVPWREVLQNEHRFTRAQMGNYANPIVLVLHWWQGRRISQRSRERHDLTAARRRLLAVELALRSYKCDHGSGPAKLTQLVPKYLRQLPTDPFSGKPLIYRPSGTNWVLYSLGADRMDDGGKPTRKVSKDDHLGSGGSKSGNTQNKGDLLYDSAW